MIDFFYLIVAYGICFGLMNDKIAVVPLVRRVRLIDQMFECAYCTGFHCGWFVWVLRGLVVEFPTDRVTLCAQVLVWGFAGAASCYIIDATVKWFEVSALSSGE